MGPKRSMSAALHAASLAGTEPVAKAEGIEPDHVDKNHSNAAERGRHLLGHECPGNKQDESECAGWFYPTPWINQRWI